MIAFNIPVIYTIDVGSDGDIDTGSDAYIRDLTSQGKIFESMADGNDTFRNMTGSPV